MFDATIERAVKNAPKLKPGEQGATGVHCGNGRGIYIVYHTIGKANICDDTQEMTSEHLDWKLHGCANNEEWQAYLNKCFWDGL